MIKNNDIQPKQQDAESLHFLDYWRVIKSRKEIVLAVFLIVVIVGTSVTFMIKPKFESTAKIEIEQDSVNSIVFGQASNANYDPFFLLTEEEIIQSTRILYPVIEKLRLNEIYGKRYLDDETPLATDQTYKVLRGNMSIMQQRNTKVMHIIVRSEDPQEASRIANEIANEYREYRLSEQYNHITRGIEAMNLELAKQSQRVDVAEDEVERIRKEENITITGRGVPLSKQRLEQLESDRIANSTDVISRQSRLNAIEEMTLDEFLGSLSVLAFDSTVQKLRDQLIDSQMSLKLMQQNLGPRHPDVIRLEAGVNEIRLELEKALKGLRAGLRADHNIARDRLRQIEEELNKQLALEMDMESDSMRKFAKAQRQVRLERGIMDALAAKIAQTGIDLNVPRTPPVKLFNPAEPNNRPVSPNIPVMIVLSVFLGLASGIGLAYFIEYLDTSVKTVDDLENYLGLSVIGVIPQKVKPLNQEGPDSPHAEAYRVLRTNLVFQNKGVNGGAYTVVSAGVGEGKSTTLFNLAYVCARMGDKVLIVDSDLRRPVQHSILGVSNRFGLTNVLMRDVPLEETIKTTSEPNLHFLPSGKLPRNAVGLLDSQRIRELIKSLKSRYDYVFFDSPPVIGVSDASIIASEVDGVLLVVQYRKYPRVMSSRAKRLIENVGGNILGVVLNNINILRDDYYYYYQSYYSHYAHPENIEPAPESPGRKKS